MVYTRGGVISGSYLPNASVVGLFLQKEDGTPYDNLPYNNIPYVATGTGDSQTWAPQSGDKQIYLSSTDGKAYAYYPYNVENTSISSIHLDASRQDDVMYCSTASTGLNDKNADASFDLQHALAVMKVKVKKGNYTGAGEVTSCSISGSPIGLTGTLDGRTGNLSGVTAGKVSADKSYTISQTATDHDIIFVPTTTSGQVTVGLTMDGKEYTTTTTSSDTFQPNQCYTLNLTVDASGTTITGIQIGSWNIEGNENTIITVGGHKVTFAGDFSDMALDNSVQGNSVTIKATNFYGHGINNVTIDGSADLTQTTNGTWSIITLANIESDITLNFYGLNKTLLTGQTFGGNALYGYRLLVNGVEVYSGRTSTTFNYYAGDQIKIVLPESENTYVYMDGTQMELKPENTGYVQLTVTATTTHNFTVSCGDGPTAP